MGRQGVDGVNWSEQRPGWDPGTHSHEAILAGKPQSLEVKRKRNQGDKSNLTLSFRINRSNPSSWDLSRWMRRPARSWAAALCPLSPSHPLLGGDSPPKAGWEAVLGEAPPHPNQKPVWALPAQTPVCSARPSHPNAFAFPHSWTTAGGSPRHPQPTLRRWDPSPACSTDPKMKN